MQIGCMLLSKIYDMPVSEWLHILGPTSERGTFSVKQAKQLTDFKNSCCMCVYTSCRTEAEVRQIVKEVDADGRGVINFPGECCPMQTTAELHVSVITTAS